ncbi:MAG: PPC domain-containing DNA-binding protein [Leucobacter sp.]
MRPLVHPGTKIHPRIISVPVRTRRATCELRPDRPLVEQLHETLSKLGADSGYAEIHGGDLSPLSYCIPDVATPEKALSFSEPRSHETAYLVYGSVTLGLRDGDPYMHSHCCWQEPNGALEGGHVWFETEPGAAAPFAAVTAVYGAQWNSATDPETRMPVFTPTKRSIEMPDHDTLEADTIVARVLPNEDITEAVLKVCHEYAFGRATLRAGLGSFIGATFIDRATGERRTVDGPATEVIALVGDVRTVDGTRTARLSGTLVDRHGVLHAGELVPGENLVAATFELTLQRVDRLRGTPNPIATPIPNEGETS